MTPNPQRAEPLSPVPDQTEILELGGSDARFETEFDPATVSLPSKFEAPEPRHHQIPVCYALGEDLVETAQRLQITSEQLAELHASTEYTCYAVGFCPGFGYLGHLPDPLNGVPRRSKPRTRVEPGSVGITGSQTGIYPLPRPGGWALIGRTPLTLVDVADAYFPIQAGDTVRFFAIPVEEFEARQGERL